MYVYKNGMRFLAEDKVKEGFHYHDDISIKIGKNIVRTLQLHVDVRLGAGVPIPFKIKLKKVNFVKLNGHVLTPKIDYVINNNNAAVAFTFNLISSDKIEIEGLT